MTPAAPASKEKILALLLELVGPKCHCGEKKRRQQTFCRACYDRLPRPMQGHLYRKIGEGYEEAYADATRFLDGKGGIEEHQP